MDSLRGSLLIASPAVQDPRFRKTVVLVAEHTDDGAMGVVLNRPADSTVGSAVPELEPVAGSDEHVHIGGPVSETAVTVLAEFDDPSAAALLIDGDLGFVGSQAGDPVEVAEAVRRTRVFAGHAGWSAGQLEEEMEEESWIVEPASREDVFTEDPQHLWERILRRKGGDFAVIATMPDDPSLN
jgi:putative transcriptional regulator